MKLGDRMPISVKKNKAWPFLGIDEECWYGANTDNQGTGIIEGSYLDYVVEHLIPKQTKAKTETGNNSYLASYTINCTHVDFMIFIAVIVQLLIFIMIILHVNNSYSVI